MIRFFDAIILAHTKLRTHKIRTGITIGVAGILFGLILGAIFVVQGVFDSLERFGEEGLGDRAIVTLTKMSKTYPVYEHLEDQQFIAEVEALHKAFVNNKATIAKKHNVPYDSESEDPSPIQVDKKSKKKSIDGQDMMNTFVMQAAQARQNKVAKPFDVHEYLAPYKTAKILPNNAKLSGLDGASFLYMKDGKEFSTDDQRKIQMLQMGGEDNPTLMIINQSIADAFMGKQSRFDPNKGELPVIVPFKDAEKLLKLKPLKGEASTQQKYDRLKDVRSRMSEMTASFCYRNETSQQLLAQAKSQHDEAKRKVDDPDYRAPSLQYTLPADNSCGPVATSKDTRTSLEKRFMENRLAYEKELQVYTGEPEQYKVNLRVVGVSGDTPEGMASFDAAGMVQSLLGSWLGYGQQWAIPSEMLRQMPESSLPSFVQAAMKSDSVKTKNSILDNEDYLVEFGDVAEARALLKRDGLLNVDAAIGNSTFALPFGSGMLVVEDLKEYFATGVFWALLIVGGVAIIILGSIIGRAVSEGRRESAIFRAIGARRADIGAIYGVYAFLLSLRVAIFAVLLGVILALGVEVWLSESATLGARYSYAATDANTGFHFFSPFSIYVPIVLAAILVFGMIASIVPVILSARRNPIKDMRDDT
ncbi:ABC transporter permease [Candidatus Saccharibacteria bacterium TM7i]|nr:ABC transporter permease [Candidatus Saccharibacteria bacterium TM7i]